MTPSQNENNRLSYCRWEKIPHNGETRRRTKNMTKKGSVGEELYALYFAMVREADALKAKRRFVADSAGEANSSLKELEGREAALREWAEYVWGRKLAIDVMEALEEGKRK